MVWYMVCKLVWYGLQLGSAGGSWTEVIAYKAVMGPGYALPYDHCCVNWVALMMLLEYDRRPMWLRTAIDFSRLQRRIIFIKYKELLHGGADNVRTWQNQRF